MSAYKRHRFLPDIISYAVWLYYRFNLSHRRDAGPLITNLSFSGFIILYFGALICVRVYILVETTIIAYRGSGIDYDAS